MSESGGPQLRGKLDEMKRMELVTIAYTFSCMAAIAVVLGGSQALLTELVEDGLSLLPPVLVLIGDRISRRPATEEYPFGFDRAITAAYMGASLTLLATGLLLLGDALLKLAFSEHPSIGGLALGGHVYWIGWAAMPVLVWCAVPAFFMGRTKIKLARQVCDKVLLADALNKTANWQSAAAAMLGLLGVAAGFWWADAAAALVISFEIVRSGWSEVSNALADLMDRRPRKFGEKQDDPMPGQLTAFLKSQDWIADAVVRVREKGRGFIAEAAIVPREARELPDLLDRTAAEALRISPRLSHIALIPTAAIPNRPFEE